MPPLYRSCQKNYQKQCVVVSRNVGGMTLGDDPEANGIFHGSNVMHDAIATDGLPDSESFVTCPTAALVMNFMNRSRP